MPNFYGGLKRLFNLKEISQKKEEAEQGSDEQTREADPAEVAEKIAAAQEEIKNKQLAPASLDGLSADEQPVGEQIIQEADTNLNLAKDKSLGNLAQVEKLTFTAGVVDTTDILRGKAYRGASEKMTADKSELKGIKGFLEKIWKYNFAEQYLHEKQRVDVKKKIIESGNLYIAENLTVGEKEAAQRGFSEATLARFIPGIKDLVEENLGEKREELKESPETTKIKDSLKKIVNDYADGKLDEAGFEGAKRNVFAEIEKSNNQETLKNSEMYVDNFLEIARQVKEIKDNIRLASDHQAKLAQFDFDINLVLGKAKEGVKTETHYNIAERTVEKMRQTKLGSLVNETTLAAAVGLTYSAASFFSQRVLRSKAMAIGTLGAAVGVSSAYAGIKESQMQKRERQTLEARDTTGLVDMTKEKTRVAKDLMALEYAKAGTTDRKELKKIDKQMKNLEAEQEKLLTQEKFLYKKKTAGELRASLETAVNSPLKSAAEVETVLNNLADIEARLELSNENKIDLVSYSSLTNVETERQKLLQAKWQAKQQLKSSAAGISPDWETRLKDLTVLCRQELLDDKDDGIKKKDAAFNKYKNKEILKKVSQAAVVGVTVGVLAQEVFAAFSDKQEGLVENWVKGDNRALGDRDTALEALRNFITGHDSAGNLQEVAIDNGLIKLPANCSWLHNPDGSFNLLRGSEVLAENLQVNPDGSLTEEAKNILAAEHINVNASQYAIESGGTAAVHTGPEDYVNKHPQDFKQISRGLWYGNDTPMYKGADGKMHGADLNELRAHWGGDHGTGINLKTNCYEMSAIKMMPDGSFQTVNGDKLSENAAELIKEGKMKFLFSLSDGTQNQVIELPIDPTTGKISVERGSELAKLLFAEKNGQAVLQARFAEVATSSGIGKDGVEQVHVFATAVGEGLKGVDEIINTPPQMGTATSLDIPREMATPFYVPGGFRTPLAPVNKKEEPEIFPSGYNSYYGYSGDLKKDRRELKSYRNNPGNVDLERLKKILGVINPQAEQLDNNNSNDDEILNGKRKPLFITLDRDNYDTSVKLKGDNIKLKDYRDQGRKFLNLVTELKDSPKYKKYGFVINQLKFYVNYDNLSQVEKEKITVDCKHYNQQRNGGGELNTEDYVRMQIGRLQNQIENVFLSEAKVGEKPFSPDFYKESPLVKGIDRAEEIVIILDDPIGDEVVTVPVVLAVQRYLEENKLNKPIKLAVSKTGLKLFQCLVDQFPGQIELSESGHVDKVNKANSFKQLKENFANDHKEKFVINTHKEFENYDLLNMDDDGAKDMSRVMSVDWSSWDKEEIPKRKGVIEKYDPIPARIMRNFEAMFGQKLFSDINKMDHFLEKGKNYDRVSVELKNKYKIKDGEDVIVISAGSGVMPKEYEPEKWDKAIRAILKEHPQSKVLFIEDPNKQRQDRYNPMVQKLIEDTGRISLVREPLDNMNTIMSMADLVITPDTGFGHYAAALGKPNIMLILGDPVRWSSAKTERIIHKKARESYAKNKGTYDKAWTPNSGYYVNDNGEMIGASNLSPELITKAADKYLKK